MFSSCTSMEKIGWLGLLTQSMWWMLGRENGLITIYYRGDHIGSKNNQWIMNLGHVKEAFVVMVTKPTLIVIRKRKQTEVSLLKSRIADPLKHSDFLPLWTVWLYNIIQVFVCLWWRRVQFLWRMDGILPWYSSSVIAYDSVTVIKFIFIFIVLLHTSNLISYSHVYKIHVAVWLEL